MSSKGKEKALKYIEIVETMKELNETGYDSNNNILPSLKSDLFFEVPSGEQGNVLALALEMNYYIVARHILLNNDYYEMDLDNALITNDGYTFSAKDAYDYSLNYFEDKEHLNELIKDKDIEDIKNVVYFMKNRNIFYEIRRLERNVAASEEINDLLKKDKIKSK